MHPLPRARPQADNKLAAAFNKGQYGTEQGKQN